MNAASSEGLHGWEVWWQCGGSEFGGNDTNNAKGVITDPPNLQARVLVDPRNHIRIVTSVVIKMN